MFGSLADLSWRQALGFAENLSETEPGQIRLLRIIFNLEQPVRERRQTNTMHHPLDDFINDSHDQTAPEPAGARKLQTLVSQLQHGRIPGLDDLLRDFPVNLDSPEARQMLARYAYFLNQAGPVGRQRAEQLGLALHIRGRQNLLKKMEDLAEGLNPDSQEALILQGNILAVRNAVSELVGLLAQFIENDATRGSFADTSRKTDQVQTPWFREIFSRMLRPLHRLARKCLR